MKLAINNQTASAGELVKTVSKLEVKGQDPSEIFDLDSCGGGLHFSGVTVWHGGWLVLRGDMRWK